jgi:peptidyl-prolyl cis-trans isomerase C
MATKSLTRLNAEIARLRQELEDKVERARAEDELAELQTALGAADDAPAPVEEVDEGTEVDEVDADTEDAEVYADTEDADTAPDAGEARPGRLARLVPRTRRSIAAVALLAAVAIAGGVFTAVRLWPTDTLPSGVAFRVFGHDVTATALDDELQTLGALYGIAAPSGQAARATFRRNAAKAYAVSLVLDHAAVGRHIVVADKKARDVLTRYISQQFGDSSDATTAFITALGNVGTTEQAVLTEIKRQLAISALFDDVTKGVTVTDAQVAAEFAKHKGELATPEQRDIRNIVVTSEADARTLLAKLGNGADFATLAKRDSLDAQTRSAGGDLGTVAAEQLDAGYAKVAFAAEVGAPFGPVKTQYGWNVGVVTSASPAQPAVFDTVKADLEQQMVLTQELVKWRRWLAGQIRAAGVDYADAYRPADPDAAPSGAPGAPQVPGAASPAPAAARSHSG